MSRAVEHASDGDLRVKQLEQIEQMSRAFVLANDAWLKGQEPFELAQHAYREMKKALGMPVPDAAARKETAP